LILDGLGCVSENQFNAINTLLRNGGIVWLGLPFGTHDEKGYKRDVPLSVKLLKRKTNNLILRKDLSISGFLNYLLVKTKFHPVLVQLSGDPGWAARIRFYNKKPVIHFLNRKLVAVPHPALKDIPGNPILKDIESHIEDNHLVFKVNAGKLKLKDLYAWSPESGDLSRHAGIVATEKGYSTLDINLEGIKIYAVLQ